MTQPQVDSHIEAAGQLWTARSRRIWELDLTMLTGVGLTLARADRPNARHAVAQRELDKIRQASR
jgi:hypothetical protein